MVVRDKCAERQHVEPRLARLAITEFIAQCVSPVVRLPPEYENAIICFAYIEALHRTKVRRTQRNQGMVKVFHAGIVVGLHFVPSCEAVPTCADRLEPRDADRRVGCTTWVHRDAVGMRIINFNVEYGVRQGIGEDDVTVVEGVRGGVQAAPRQADAGHARRDERKKDCREDAAGAVDREYARAVSVAEQPIRHANHVADADPQKALLQHLPGDDAPVIELRCRGAVDLFRGVGAVRNPLKLHRRRKLAGDRQVGNVPAQLVFHEVGIAVDKLADDLIRQVLIVVVDVQGAPDDVRRVDDGAEGPTRILPNDAMLARRSIHAPPPALCDERGDLVFVPVVLQDDVALQAVGVAELVEPLQGFVVDLVVLQPKATDQFSVFIVEALKPLAEECARVACPLSRNPCLRRGVPCGDQLPAVGIEPLDAVVELAGGLDAHG